MTDEEHEDEYNPHGYHVHIKSEKLIDLHTILNNPERLLEDDDIEIETEGQPVDRFNY